MSYNNYDERPRRNNYDDRNDNRYNRNDSRGGDNGYHSRGHQENNFRGGYKSGGGRGGYQGGRSDDLSHKMGQMNMRNGGGNMYSQQNSRPPMNRNSNSNGGGHLAGSAMNPRMPVAKKDLIHNTQEFAQRPDGRVFEKKAVGTKTELLTNHALVHLPEQAKKMYCYNIDILSGGKQVIKREQASPMFHELVKKNRRDFPNPSSLVFNDVNILWSDTQLPRGEGRVGDRRTCMVWKFASILDFGQTIKSDQDKQTMATLIDAIATSRVRVHSKYTVFKRSMFMMGTAHDSGITDAPLTIGLRNGMDARCGVSIGIRLNLRAGITACYDLAHTIFTRPGYPLVRLLCELINHDPISDQEFEDHWDQRLQDAVFSQSNRNELDRILKKMKLRYRAEKGAKEREFKYHAVSDSSAERTYFNDENGRKVSIADFFLNAYNIRLRYPNLPCLVKKPSKANGFKFIAFPMEMISYIEDPKRFEGYVSERTKTDMISSTAYTAQQRRVLLQRIMGQKMIGDVPAVVDNNDPVMKRHGLSIEKEMLSVKATVLPPPTVVYGEGSTFKDSEHVGEWTAVTHEPIRKVLEGSTTVRNSDAEAPKKTKRLIGSIMHVGSPVNGNAKMAYDPQCYHRIMRAIEASGQPVAWDQKEQGFAAIQGVHEYCQGVTDPYSIVEFFQRLKANIDEKYKESEDEVLIPFVLVVFQVRCTNLKNHADQWYNDYNFIKYLADNEVGIYTQGILLENLTVIQESPIACKLTRLLVEKVLGKIGTTHRKLERNGDHKSWTKITDPKAPTLILGVDVSHPSPRDRMENDIRKLSVATVVGNIDIDCTEYRASSRIQETGEENIVRFQAEVQARLNAFIQNTKTRPAHIVVYRDGICEGDFQRILYEERIVIEQCCLDLDMSYQPTITYIVVSKRHHTRFFLKDESEGKECQGFNILPGTLVEDTITTKDYYDFFLSTQVGQVGLARPTHYYVLHDTWKPFVSFWPTVTHALTYMFCRTTNTVSLPAPVLYAHLAAKRSKECLDGAWTVAEMKRIRLSVDNFSDVNKLTVSINTNNGLDGMTFV